MAFSLESIGNRRFPFVPAQKSSFTRCFGYVSQLLVLAATGSGFLYGMSEAVASAD
ncbi:MULTISPECIES: hypothetical protein [Comamonas]|jgi:hypothetical protein|uniref:hypothetical protein n=1 Tax=Comamonas TaxID=283 RepID=UPI000ABB98EE|nr:MULTISPECIES: hypothetical protein [Comamonas]